MRSSSASSTTLTATQRNLRNEPTYLRPILIGIVLAGFILFLFLPVLLVLLGAFEKGFFVYIQSIMDPEALAAIRLTLFAAIIAIFANGIFGLAVAWVITKYHFRFKKFLLTLVEIPFSVSPVISGLIFVLLFGSRGVFGPWLQAHDIKIIFAIPGIIIVSIFVTLPFVAKQLIPLMEAQGQEEEISAVTLGANGWQTFFRVTLPNIKWGLLYGIILCNARAMGEFGAVSVVSGHIQGLTNTMPLQIEILYNEYNFAAAFAVSSLLLMLAFVTLLLKHIVEWQNSKLMRGTNNP